MLCFCIHFQFLSVFCYFTKPLHEGQMEVFHAGRMGFPELKGPNVTWEPGLLVIDNGNLIDFGFGFFFFTLGHVRN